MPRHGFTFILAKSGLFYNDPHVDWLDLEPEVVYTLKNSASATHSGAMIFDLRFSLIEHVSYVLPPQTANAEDLTFSDGLTAQAFSKDHPEVLVMCHEQSGLNFFLNGHKTGELSDPTIDDIVLQINSHRSTTIRDAITERFCEFLKK